MLESEIESKVTEHAKKIGVLHLKLRIIGSRGWPDHLYLYKGRCMFIEFKQLGEKPTRLQKEIHDRLKFHGGNVKVVDSVVAGYGIINEFTQGR